MIRLTIPKSVQLGEKWKLLAFALGGSAGILATIAYLTR